MIYGVFSDVHGNYEALRVVLKKLFAYHVDAYICCGDLVGYGPQPNECVELVSSLPGVKCVIGNHDMAVLGRLPLDWFNTCAEQAINFTRKELSPRSLAYLESLPLTLVFDDITMVHGSPKNPAEEYLLTGEQFMENAEHWHTTVCFVGHSHVPLVMSRHGVRFPLVNMLYHSEKVRMEQGMRYVFNAGSVGQPRDRNPRASCGVFDTETKTFELFRLDYPVESTQETMRKVNLPDLLIERIGNGW